MIGQQYRPVEHLFIDGCSDDATVSIIRGYQEKYAATADWDYNIRCYAQYKFTYTDTVIAYFEGGGKSSSPEPHSFYEDLPECVIRYFGLDPNDRSLHDPASPFYYPVSRYSLDKCLKANTELHQELEKLKIGVV